MDVARAVQILKSGGLVAFPTETVYGLGADASQPSAVARLFEVKGRPPGRPLTVHLGDEADPDRWCLWSGAAARLADAFWPGPLTLVLPRRPTVHDVVTGGLSSVGLRVPAHPLALELLHAFGGGVAAPSANLTGRPSPTSAAHVRADFGDTLGCILDGGDCPLGVESTVVSLVGSSAVVLRLGAIARPALAQILGYIPRVLPPTGTEVRPASPVWLVSAQQLIVEATDQDAVFARVAPPTCCAFVRAPDTPQAYGRRLFAALRELDARQPARILVENVPIGDSWEAIRSRLRSAIPVEPDAEI